ncbi:unnamed protein product [Caenorhabditis nigoni]
MLPLTKASGYAFDGYLVYRILKRKSDINFNDKAKASVAIVIPSFLILAIQFFETIIDMMLPLTKASGYALDGYLVYRVLKRRSDTNTNVQAKASAASGPLFQAPLGLQ